MIQNDLREQLGPLADLVDVWEGDKGDDIAPSDDRGTENNKYRERLTLELIKSVQNHEQNLNVLPLLYEGLATRRRRALPSSRSQYLKACGMNFRA